jgi:hypothetical protein
MTGPTNEASAAPRFQPNRAILLPGLLAPLPVAPNSRQHLQTAFRILLALGKPPEQLREAAATTGGGLIHACQEMILASNRLLTDDPKALSGPVSTLLWATKDILGAQRAVYVLEQALEGFPEGSAPPAWGFKGHKELGAALEKRFADFPFPAHMDPERFGILQVQLDDVYDFAALQLQRFYAVLAEVEVEPAAAGPIPRPSVAQGTSDRPAPAASAFRRFARDLAASVKSVIPDHLLGVGGGSGRERTGLADLLPELEREVAAV